MIVLSFVCLHDSGEKPLRPQGSVDACTAQRYAGTTQLQVDLPHNQNFRGTTRMFRQSFAATLDTQIERYDGVTIHYGGLLLR